MPGIDPEWQFLRFDELGVRGLYEVLQLRCRVFILEQGPYLDPDGWDEHSWHLLGRAPAGGRLLAYLRIVDPGVRFAEPSIGRVISAPEVRGTGLGRVLMQEGLRRHAQVWPGRANRISAQAHLERFYASLGYRTVGEPYAEDSIPHVAMLREAD
jgi:ElaA protein